MAAFSPWLLEFVTCAGPGCGAALTARPAGDGLGCRTCGALYPILGGVPVLLPDPAGYLASHRDAVLASLAERGLATRGARATLDAFVDAFVEAAGAVEARRFGDDWTATEAPPPPDEALAAWVLAAAARDPIATLLAAVPPRLGAVIDVGSGDGALAAALAPRSARVIVADLSLRAALRAAARVRGARPRAEVAAVVLDAEALPLRPARFDLVSAMNLVDLLEAPGAFLTGARAALRPGGRVALSVPQPQGLDALIDEGGLVVERDAAAVPWLRMHHERHLQIYFPRVVVARRPRGSSALSARASSRRAREGR